jgi:hypothetical protein
MSAFLAALSGMIILSGYFYPNLTTSVLISGTVMVFIDSFGTIPEAFLTTAYQNVIAVDLRWVLRTGMEESAVDFINQYEPDVVIVAFNPSQIGNTESEQFIYGVPEK